MLDVAGAEVRAGGRAILRDASIAVGAGELVAVIGPNGAGKSTLLSVMAGTRTPSAGAAALDGRPLGDWPGAALARRRAVLPQSTPLSFPFRALEVVLLGRSPHAGLSTRDGDLAVAESAMREAGVVHLADRLYPTLSGGEMQRVQFARVLAQVWPEDGSRPASGRLLLLDEPTNNLDMAYQHGALRTVRRLAEASFAVVAVLHDANLAALYADRVVVMQDGLIVADGAPAEVLSAELVERVFGLPVRILSHPTTGRPMICAG